jgi:hypothetical protein
VQTLKTRYAKGGDAVDLGWDATDDYEGGRVAGSGSSSGSTEVQEAIRSTSTAVDSSSSSSVTGGEGIQGSEGAQEGTTTCTHLTESAAAAISDQDDAKVSSSTAYVASPPLSSSTSESSRLSELGFFPAILLHSAVAELRAQGGAYILQQSTVRTCTLLP